MRPLRNPREPVGTMHMQSLLTQLQSYAFAPGADAARIFHGRGQCFAGLEWVNIDWYEPTLLVTLYRQPQPEDWAQLQSCLQDLPVAVANILVQQRYQRGGPIEVLRGELPQRALAREAGLVFQLSFGDKQNIGYFPDMAPARAWLRERVAGGRVLNLFAYTGAFSVAAIAAGAHSVLNVDMSKAALNVARDNHRLNDQQGALQRDVQMLPYNVFKSWNRIIAAGPFDYVIIDPPSRQKGSFVAERDYARVVKKLSQLLAPDAEVLACLNAPHLGEDFLRGLFAEHAEALAFVARLPNRADFPERDPQCNLKMLNFRRGVSGVAG